MKEQSAQQSSDFLKKFTLAVLQVVEKRDFNIVPKTKEIIDADLVPELSHELLREFELNKRLMQKLKEVESISSTQTQTTQPSRQKGTPKQKPQAPRVPQPPQPSQPQEEGETHGFEKILPMLSDYSVSRIQCIAPNKPLIIVRTGQRYITKIALTAQEITDVFKGVSDQAHIPLIEGPFKVSLKEYTVNGINTRVANARFIIQKQTAYSLLEEKKKQ